MIDACRLHFMIHIKHDRGAPEPPDAEHRAANNGNAGALLIPIKRPSTHRVPASA